MEYLRIFIPFQPEAVDTDVEEQEDDEMFVSNVISVEDEDSEKADEQIRVALNNGFKIVSTAPITGTYITEESNEDEAPVVKTYTYTDGIEVFLVKG
jgi:hypothetical protein